MNACRLQHFSRCVFYPANVFFEWIIGGVSVQRRALKWVTPQSYAYADSRPADQRGNDTLTCGYDRFFRRQRLFFSRRVSKLHLGNLRHIPSERTFREAVPNLAYSMFFLAFAHNHLAVLPEVLFANEDHNPRHGRLGDTTVKYNHASPDGCRRKPTTFPRAI